MHLRLVTYYIAVQRYIRLKQPPKSAQASREKPRLCLVSPCVVNLKTKLVLLS